MKSIFGFLTGAAIGAGGLFGLRKVFAKLEEPAAPVGSSPSPATVRPPGTPETSSTTSPVKEEESPGMDPVQPTEPADLTETGTGLNKVETAASTTSTPENSASLVGEPAERHQEPVAAAESAPEAITPRSESTEVAVPEKVAVEPVKTTPVKPKENATLKASSNGNKNGKSSRKNTRPSQKDDFTIILDIGPIFNQKLHEAGINSFRDLARLTPAQVEEKTGIPAERVEHGRWIEQVQQILAGKAKE